MQLANEQGATIELTRAARLLLGAHMRAGPVLVFRGVIPKVIIAPRPLQSIFRDIDVLHGKGRRHESRDLLRGARGGGTRSATRVS